jgi:hypothetical protein
MKPEDCFKPKHHMMWHLIYNIAEHGNPKSYATWKDESLNKQLKAVCRFTSQLTFENSVLTRMQELLGTKKRGRDE